MKFVATKSLCRAAVALTLLMHAPAWSQGGSDAEKRSLEEVRNTVVNLLEALVQKGVMTREQAESMVADAQAKATADADARAAKDASESDAVRVTYVPEIVRKQISDQVREDVKEEVTKEVMAQAKADGWGVPGALPEWIKGVKLYGDVRARAQGDLYASDNATNVYLNFDAVNSAGGRGRAGVNALLNVSEDRNRFVGRVRTGFIAQLGNDFNLDVRLASGNLRSPVSTNQTLGNYGGRWQVNVDKAAVIWNPINAAHDREFDLRVGRFNNPFVSINELVWDNDLTFEGISATYAMDLFGNQPDRMERGLFLTVGAFPLQEVELSKDDKWLYGGQLGAEITSAAIRACGSRAVTSITTTSPASAIRSRATFSISPRRRSCKRATPCSAFAMTTTTAPTCSRWRESMSWRTPACGWTWASATRTSWSAANTSRTWAGKPKMCSSAPAAWSMNVPKVMSSA